MTWGRDEVHAHARPPTIVEYSIPTAQSGALYITGAADGSLWFTENSANKVARILPSGKIRELSLPTLNSEPVAIVAGLDGKLWFTEYATDKIGIIAPNGAVREFAGTSPGAAPIGIAISPSGEVWFAQWYHDGIGRIDPSGANLVYPLSPAKVHGAPSLLVVDLDNTIWFTETQSVSPIGTITKTGDIGEVYVPSTPTPSTPGPNCSPKPCVFYPPNPQYGVFATRPPAGILFSQELHRKTFSNVISASDGTIWFGAGSSLGRIHRPNSLRYFKLDSSKADAFNVAVGSDGCIWFTEFGVNRIGRITPLGEIREFEIPTRNSGPFGIASGKNGDIWFVERNANKIGRLERPALTIGRCTLTKGTSKAPTSVQRS